MGKYVRHKIIQEEIVDAEQSLIPCSIKEHEHGKLTGRNKQVNVGDWVVTHADKTQDVYTNEDFHVVYKPMKRGEEDAAIGQRQTGAGQEISKEEPRRESDRESRGNVSKSGKDDSRS